MFSIYESDRLTPGEMICAGSKKSLSIMTEILIDIPRLYDQAATGHCPLGFCQFIHIDCHHVEAFLFQSLARPGK